MEKTWQNCDFTNNWMSLYKGWEEEMKTGERGHVSNKRAEAAPNLTTISSVLHLWALQEPFLLQPSKPGWMMKKTKTKKRHLMWSDETRGWNLLVSLVPAGKNTQARHPENTAPPRSMAEAAYGSELQWPGVYKAWVRQKVGVCFGRSGPESDICGGEIWGGLCTGDALAIWQIWSFSKEL